MSSTPSQPLLHFAKAEADAFEAAGFPQLTLGPLDRHACGELVSARLGHRIPDAAADRLYRLTGGNTLAMVELAHLADTPSAIERMAPTERAETTLERVFARRIEQLSGMAQRVLLVAAVEEAGEMAVVGPAARSLGLDPIALEEAEAAGLASLSEGRVVFRHPLIRSAVYRSAPAERAPSGAPGGRELARTREAPTPGVASGRRCG